MTNMFVLDIDNRNLKQPARYIYPMAPFTGPNIFVKFELKRGFFVSLAFFLFVFFLGLSRLSG